MTVTHMQRQHEEIRLAKQSEVAVMLVYGFFDALQPNEHGSTWHPQHEHALQEEASGVARLQYAVAAGNRYG
jgi:hypothetical protein